MVVYLVAGAVILLGRHVYRTYRDRPMPRSVRIGYVLAMVVLIALLLWWILPIDLVIDYYRSSPKGAGAR